MTPTHCRSKAALLPMTGFHARSTHAVVLIGGRPEQTLAVAVDMLAILGIEVHAVSRLGDGPVPAFELRVSGVSSGRLTSNGLRRALAAAVASAGAPADVAVEPIERRQGDQRLVIFDVDSTLLRGELIDQLAARVGRADEVSAITDAAMRGELDFTASLRARVAILAGLEEAALDEIRTRLRYTDGARTTVQALRRHGFRCGAVSGGFNQIVRAVADELELDFFVANELEVQDGRLTGRLVGPCIDRPAKAAVLRNAAESYGVPISHCVAVGDGANDIDMLSLAGLGVAFNARPALREVADVVLSSPRMESLLYVLGIPTHDFLGSCSDPLGIDAVIAA